MLSYSVSSSHRIGMAFHQSMITFSFYLIRSSLEEWKKLISYKYQLCQEKTSEQDIHVCILSEQDIWFTNTATSYGYKLSVKDFGLTKLVNSSTNSCGSDNASLYKGIQYKNGYIKLFLQNQLQINY